MTLGVASTRSSRRARETLDGSRDGARSGVLRCRKVVQVREAALDKPALTPELRAVLDATPCDDGLDALRPTAVGGTCPDRVRWADAAPRRRTVIAQEDPGVRCDRPGGRRSAAAGLPARRGRRVRAR